MKKIILLSFVAFSFIGNAQTTTPPAAAATPAAKEWDVSMYGFIRTDYIWDTRKSVQVRELNLNLYPMDESLLTTDGNKDQNAVGQSNFLSVVSRLGTKVKGPNVWGAKMNGTLEGDFFGNTEGTPSSIGLFRLRHAFVNMDWAKSSLTVGQTWYPAFVPEVFPGVANFSTGILFNPFGWASQVKFKQNLTKQISLAITAYKEREFTNYAATGQAQNSASINSSLPTLNGHFQFKNANWIAGLQAEYKSIQPLTVSNTKMSTEKVNSTAIIGYAKYNNDKFSVKAYGITGGNLSSFVMLGGYAGYTTSPTEVETYEAIKTTAFWLDIASNGKKVAPGLFFGMTQNNGTGKDNATAFYGRGVSTGRTVAKVMRVSGRVDFKQNKFRVTPEIEYTGATWGDQSAKKDGTADLNSKNVSNMRFMVSCAYSF
ncbi:MAG: hypothetical protein ACOYBS_05660 [Flavobacterium sp.]